MSSDNDKSCSIWQRLEAIVDLHNNVKQKNDIRRSASSLSTWDGRQEGRSMPQDVCGALDNGVSVGADSAIAMTLSSTNGAWNLQWNRQTEKIYCEGV